MKVFSIRVPEEVCVKLKTMDKDDLRKILAEITGITYKEKNKLILIENIVKKYLDENLARLDIKEKEEKGDKDMTSKAMNAVLEIIG
ncbi:hypothetical protein FQB35_09600 [Crassaminicella thermophila]|uniref:Uncharacterized protein n=1 Tax=Crassaminicella thermophila TaxID=2599308 RepID=A0A5C0SH52_CRATE|nr:hypothetical protein [Crassaminicella thermophila]QEK12558.1 hypothetical protein FQB35_09600 [Crassaminicella thermophila]